MFKTLEGKTDLNSPRQLSYKALVTEKLQNAYVNHENPKLSCILVISSSKHYSKGILIKTADIFSEWIFVPNKLSKKLKTFVEKVT